MRAKNSLLATLTLVAGLGGVHSAQAQGSGCPPSWVPLGTEDVGGPIDSMATFDDGTGPSLYLAGLFGWYPGGASVGAVLKWNGTGFQSVGFEDNSSGRAIYSYDDGSGLSLFASGNLFAPGLPPGTSIAKYDGATWAPVGAGVSGLVLAFADYHGGTSRQLYAGGDFMSAGGQPALNVARWNGVSWSPVGSGIDGRVNAFCSAALSTGRYLFAGGDFDFAGGQPASSLARWDGSSWSAVGGGIDGVIKSMTVYDDGSGPALVVAGLFSHAGGVPANNIARWDGTSWSALGAGTFGSVNAVAAYDDNFSGNQLYAAGDFTLIGSALVKKIARWNGLAWSTVEQDFIPTGTTFRALHVFDDGFGSDLYVGGSTGAWPNGDRDLAQFGGCRIAAQTGTRACFGNGGVNPGCTPCPCGNEAPGAVQGGCLNAAGSSARLHAEGDASVSADSLSIRVYQANPLTFALLFSGPNLLPFAGGCPSGSGVQSNPLKGLRCIGGGEVRHGVRALGQDGITALPWGAPNLSLLAQGGFSAGQTRHFQAFYRDLPSLGCYREINTTNSVSITVVP